MNPFLLLAGLALLAALAPAAAQGMPRLLAHGQPPAKSLRDPAPSPEGLPEVAGLDAVAAAFRAAGLPWPEGIALAAGEQALLFRLGPGHGAGLQLQAYAVTGQSQLCWMRLIASGAGSVPGRLVALAVPAAAVASMTLELQEPLPEARKEQACPPVAVRALVANPPPKPMPWTLGGTLARAPEGGLRVADWLAWQAVWQQFGFADQSLPIVDFAANEVLLVPGDSIHGHALLPLATPAGVPPDALPMPWRQLRSEPRLGPIHGSWRVLGRHAGPIHLEHELPPGSRQFAVQCLPAAPHDPELLPIWRADVIAVPPELAAGVDPVATVTDWRAVSQRLGAECAALTDAIGELAADWVVVVRTGAAARWPGCRLRVATEEGVDVLTIATRAPSGREVPSVAEAVVLKLPRRNAQLAIVLERHCGPAPPEQTTLAVLPGQRER